MSTKDDDIWDRDAATPKQLKFLKRLGVSHPDGISLDDASDLIDEALKKRNRQNQSNLLGLILVVLVAILVFVLFAHGH